MFILLEVFEYHSLVTHDRIKTVTHLPTFKTVETPYMTVGEYE